MRPLVPALVALLLAAPAFADRLSTEQVADLKHKQKKAEAEVEKKYGNKKPQDMTPEEFRKVEGEKMKAREDVLKKEGVSSKDYELSFMRQSKSDRADTEARVKDLEKKDAAAAKAKADAEAAEKAKAGGGNVQIQRGFSEDRPIELENHSGEPTVERGIPEDVQRDIDEAKLQGTDAPAGGPTEAPTGDKKSDGKKSATKK
jgi:hypothetical protein